MEVIFLVCGAGGPQLKRNPLGRRRGFLSTQGHHILLVDQLLHDTLDSIALLHKNDRITQALILLYSAMDTLAWLGTPGKTTGPIFRQWVDRYILPGNSLNCTAHDLYSARCGLLHTHAAESSDTVTGAARQIWYWTGQESRKLLEYEAGNRTDVVLVRVSDLVSALVEGAQRFVADLSQDPAQAKLAQEKARLWLAWIPAPPEA